jgi:hypothetical protein
MWWPVTPLAMVAEAIVADINTNSTTVHAASTGAVITLTYVGDGQTLANSTTGANGNVVGAYGTVAGATGYWEPAAATFSGGTSPTKWRVVLPMGSLTDRLNRSVPTQKVRKMRWTYAAAMQPGAYERSEFAAVVSNWSVTGTNRGYRVAGPGSRRLEDNHRKVSYYGGCVGENQGELLRRYDSIHRRLWRQRDDTVPVPADARAVFGDAAVDHWRRHCTTRGQRDTPRFVAACQRRGRADAGASGPVRARRAYGVDIAQWSGRVRVLLRLPGSSDSGRHRGKPAGGQDCDAGDGLGYGSLAGYSGRANGVDDLLAGVPWAGESLCGCADIL